MWATSGGASIHEPAGDYPLFENPAILTRMAETVEFRSNGGVASGYLVKPSAGSGPAVLGIQGWGGLGSGIKEMANRLGAPGFLAPPPPLHPGGLAPAREIGKAAH